MTLYLKFKVPIVIYLILIVELFLLMIRLPTVDRIVCLLVFSYVWLGDVWVSLKPFRANAGPHFTLPFYVDLVY